MSRSLATFYEDSVRDCRTSVLDGLPPADVLLDFGCSDGEVTKQFAERAGASRVFGVEVLNELAEQARARGVEIVTPGALEAGMVDVATANQVIEHLADTDAFVQEMYRVLRPGGTLIVSTNNLASWHNIAALILGAQPFPSDVSSNPAVGKLLKPPHASDTLQGEWASWTHLRVFSYRALIEMMRQHGFVVQRVQGVGYYPLPASVANRVAGWDPRHAAYLTVRCTKG